MSEPTPGFLDSTQLLFDLQQGNEIARSLSGCLDPETIAHRVTEGMVAGFGCAFARIWLVEPDRTALKLVASSGMYTQTDGSFAKVPMGAFKVGKIAQNGIPFLSNALADETWVRDRTWAIAKGIRGFAGYPLTAGGDVVGVLAVFSQQAMAPEFLEVLQSLCATVAIALELALHHQQEKQTWQQEQAWNAPKLDATNRSPLSEQLANILANVRPTLVGTEVPLSAPLTYLCLRTAEILSAMQCLYCRLTYGTTQISLEVMASSLPAKTQPAKTQERTSPFDELLFAVSCLGGTLQSYTGADQRAVQVLLVVPYPGCVLGARVCIQCRFPVLQMAFTHLAYLAGLTVCTTVADRTVPLLTDDPAQVDVLNPLLWVATHEQATPKQAKGRLDLTIAPVQLRAAVETLANGYSWGLVAKPKLGPQRLSEREQEIMALLAQGLRDRDIANSLYISDRTVKFHINNILAKLKAKTRFQALYQVTHNGWLDLEILERSRIPEPLEGT